MKIEKGYLSTSQAIRTFGLNHTWFQRHKKDLKDTYSVVEKGVNKIYYNVEDIQNLILNYANHQTTSAQS